LEQHVIFYTPNFALVAILCTFNSQGSWKSQQDWKYVNQLRVVLHGNSITMQECNLRMFKNITTTT